MDRLWAPWREAYIAKATKQQKKKRREPCLFCTVGAGRPRAGNLVLEVTPRAIVMLNLYPYNVGHVMVAPRAHKGSIAALSAAESVEITDWLGKIETALRREYRPHGFNLGMNLGRTAGAGVLGHLHWHIVPRWNGDTNYMPVLGETKVLPESLARTYRRLAGALEGSRSPARRA